MTTEVKNIIIQLDVWNVHPYITDIYTKITKKEYKLVTSCGNKIIKNIEKSILNSITKIILTKIGRRVENTGLLKLELKVLIQ
jgi:methyl coenzyme M reductase alpha subunit